MKDTKNLFSLFILILISGVLFAQSPEAINYQAVARDGSGNLLKNKSLTVRLTVLEGNSGNIKVYEETHITLTNDYGLFNLRIGQGSVTFGSFTNINWGTNENHLQVEVDAGSGYVNLGKTQFVSVPYAMHATTVENDKVDDADADPNNEIQSLSLSGQTLTISGGNSVNLPGGGGGTITQVTAGTGLTGGGSSGAVTLNAQTASALWNANKLQGKDISNTSPSNGQVLSWDGSKWTPINPTTGITYTAGSGISLSGNVISNTKPDQTVSLTGSGATSVSGTYPNFTISSTDNVNDADASTTNEIQTLSLSGNTLSLNLGGGAVSLAPFNSPWNTSGSNLYFNTGKVGIGDNSPVATLTVGNGDKLQIHGADGDIVFKDDQGSLRFANANGPNAPMIHLFQSGTNNSTRMFVAHSPSFPTWGIQYNDTSDAFDWIGDNLPVFHVQLSGQQRVGIGTFTPEAKLHVNTNSATGFGQLKLTETQFDYSRITFNNNIHPNFWDIAARTDTNLANAQVNFYHSSVGDIFSINARGRIGINDASPSYTVEINGNQSTRIINAYNNLATTASTTYNYGVRVNLSQQNNTGFPRLYNFYGISTDSDAYLTYGLYGYASGASNNNYGVYAYAPTSSGYAGYFNGNTYATGSYQTSDARLKSEVEPLQSGLATLMQLEPKKYLYDREKYDFLNLPEGEQFGFLAQDMEKIYPNLTASAFQAYDVAKSDTHEGQGFEFKVINYVGLIPVLVSAIQEQQKQIEQQKQTEQNQQQQIEALQKQVEELMKIVKN
jgi:endosialidase-like protein